MLQVLFEHATGYCLFNVLEFEDIGTFLPQVEAAVLDYVKFQKVVKLAAFKPFVNAALALENINAVSDGLVTDYLKAFLETNFHSQEDKSQLGVSDSKLSLSISDVLGISCTNTGVVPEIIRGIRLHLPKLVKGLNSLVVGKAELGLGHSYSRCKVKFNVNRSDNMIIQSISLIDQLDKDINTFSMRIREWYSYHFPELAKIVSDNNQFAMCAHFIKDKSSLMKESLEKLEEILMDSAKAQAVFDAAKMSMGMDISPIDLMNIERFAVRVVSLTKYRQQLANYLKSKMHNVAPNLSELIGEMVGARLISHAGSLTNLAKYPASTVQILGAEKALFRALKTRSNTPKYGLIFHSTFISRAGLKNKGRISRYLANKCSLATRIDCFSDVPTTVFGQKLKDQVEDRLKFYETGDVPKTNEEVMAEAVKLNTQALKCLSPKKKKTKKRKFEDTLDESQLNGEENIVPEDAEMPKKKKKKRQEQNEDAEREPAEIVGQVFAEIEGGESVKKNKKKRKQKTEDMELQEGDLSFLASKTPKKEDQYEGVEVAEEPLKKKKKKKKQLELEVHPEAEENLNNKKVVDNIENAVSKKKRKKNRNLPKEEPEEMVTEFFTTA